METLKNIALGLFGIAFVLMILAAMLLFIASALEVMDRVLLYRPDLFKPLIYTVGGFVVLTVAWALGRQMRAKPSNA